ncbi:MAG: HPF/RaiA family ribosome-associated protein [Vicinamibacterales bacterium]
MTLIPTQVTFHGIPHSEALETAIREKVAWLEHYRHDMVACHVIVDVPHRHRHDEREFSVRVEVTVPRTGPIVASNEPHADAYVAVHEAFNVARRRLQGASSSRRTGAGELQDF